ncbi:MAG: dethiobiotin synthase [Verrucomicrobiaceae bacterium]|nr:dethiobiotin synthase [Verrucomicrobiaceae bacterium]
MSNGYVITGTDTAVGKTYVTSRLVRELRLAGADAVGYKPVCCGERSDAELLVDASGGVEPIESLNPVWYQAPVAPAVAAELEGKPVRLQEIRDHAESVAARHDHLLMEGVGGWEVPVTMEETFADLAQALGWPVILVAANRLGALNHTLLSVRAIEERGLELVVVLLNHLTEEHDIAMTTNRHVLGEYLKVPIHSLEKDDDFNGHILAREILARQRGESLLH